jgi:hypothetical protein
MESSKLILLAKKLGRSLKTMRPGDICHMIMTNTHYEPVRTRLSGNEVIILSFLIYGESRGVNAEILYEKIISNLFAFSIVEITDEYPDEECHYCYGDGKYDCRTCDGTGEVDCEECGGIGEDDEGNSCDECGGDGKFECNDCNGAGEESCDYCDGTGYIEKDGYVGITQEYYVSYDKNLFSTMELKDDESEVDSNLETKINNSSKTFMFDYGDGVTDMIDDSFGGGDKMFVGSKRDPKINNRGQKLIDVNFTSYA